MIALLFGAILRLFFSAGLDALMGLW